MSLTIVEKIINCLTLTTLQVIVKYYYKVIIYG